MKKVFATLFALALLVGVMATVAGSAAARNACPDKSHNPTGTPPNCGHAPAPTPPPQPPAGNCEHAAIVLLNDQNKIVCVFLGPAAPLASKTGECPDALIALPVDNLVGVCVFLPPAQ